jgi:hypothetical protein
MNPAAAPARPRQPIPGSGRQGTPRVTAGRCRCMHVASRHPDGPCRVRACGCPQLRPGHPLLFMPEDGPGGLDDHIQKLIGTAAKPTVLTPHLWSYHTWLSEHSASGHPDRLYLRIADGTSRPGAAMWRELKRWGEYPTGTQMACLTRLRAAGCDADWWTPDDYLSGRIARELAVCAGLTAAGPGMFPARPLNRQLT